MNELNKFSILHLMRKEGVCAWLMFALTLSMTAQWLTEKCILAAIKVWYVHFLAEPS